VLAMADGSTTIHRQAHVGQFAHRCGTGLCAGQPGGAYRHHPTYSWTAGQQTREWCCATSHWSNPEPSLMPGGGEVGVTYEPKVAQNVHGGVHEGPYTVGPAAAGRTVFCRYR